MGNLKVKHDDLPNSSIIRLRPYSGLLTISSHYYTQVSSMWLSLGVHCSVILETNSHFFIILIKTSENYFHSIKWRWTCYPFQILFSWWKSVIFCPNKLFMQLVSRLLNYNRKGITEVRLSRKETFDRTGS